MTLTHPREREIALVESLAVNPDQCRAARALVRWTVRDLAREAQVGLETISRFEVGSAPKRSFRPRTIRAMQEALERAGVEFIDNGKGPGVRLVRRDSID